MTRGGPLAQLSALGVAAAWRLGRWELLEKYLVVADAVGGGSGGDGGASVLEGGGNVVLLGSQEQLDVCVGRLLLALHQER